MKANNNGTLTGRAANDPEVKGGGSVTLITIAVDGWNGKLAQKETDFFRLTAFGKTGEFIQKYVQKGRWITVATHLKVRKWEDPTSGQMRSEVSIIVDDITPGPNPNNQNRQPSAAGYDPGMTLDDPLPFGDGEVDPFSLT